jgi:hypothetical protein
MTTTKGRKPTTKTTRPKPSTEGANKELVEIISKFGPIRQLREELDRYPVELFRRVCLLSSKRNSSVPDYNLRLAPYLGEMALRALVSAELVATVDRGIHSMQAYVPTDKGKKLWQRLEAELAKA